jgi:glucosamine kinase
MQALRMHTSSLHDRRYLGLDAGGTQTRWALADASGHVCAQGLAEPISGAQLAAEPTAVLAVLRTIAAQVGQPRALVAGITGFDAAQTPQLQALAGAAFDLGAAAVHTMSDIELACRAHFQPGQGIVLIAGTGSVAAHLGAQGQLQRAGGRGAVIDDAGGGHWIATQALRQVWRREDESPGAWRQSPLACSLFEALGGSDWPQTRQWVYGATRGDIGALAQAVAAAAPHDSVALALLQQAGQELARLVNALVQRLGAQPVAATGRVFDLHPAVMQQLQTTLASGCAVQRSTQAAQHAAARLASEMPC